VSLSKRTAVMTTDIARIFHMKGYSCMRVHSECAQLYECHLFWGGS